MRIFKNGGLQLTLLESNVEPAEPVEPSLTAEIDQLTARLWDIEITAGDEASRIEPQLTHHHALLVLLSGAGTLVRDAESVRMKPDIVYIAPAESTFGFRDATGGESVVALVRFGLFRESGRGRKKLLSEEAKEFALRGDGAALSPAGRLGGLCRAMKEQRNSADPLVRWRAQISLMELLVEAHAAARRKPTADRRDALELAKAYMDEHYGEELTIDRLAGIAELSPKYFVDLFKKQYGLSALDYLTRLRMGKAKRLMLVSDMLLKDIAHEVGYEDEFYFSRKFRKSVGLSPSAFVKQRRNRLAAYGSASLLGYLEPLHVVPYAAPLHPKWAAYYYGAMGPDIAVHLDAFRHNQNKTANLRKLAEAKPELILCPSDLDPKERAALDDIADVFELPKEEEGWRAGLRGLADRLGERTEAERWIEAYEYKAGRLREQTKRGACPQVVLTARLIKNRFYAYCNRGMSDVLFDGLGASFPYGDAKAPFDLPIAPEVLDAAEADLILLLICQETETLEGWKALRQSTRWLSLRAVRDGKVRLIASDPWREYSPGAIDRMLDDADALFSGKRPY